MNIFYLNSDPVYCAQEHCDKHVVKMILEYAQLMSTAHRYIDGEHYWDRTANGRRIARWRLSDEREDVLYKATHINHPSTVWARQTNNNYNWLYYMWVQLCHEYTYRYGKEHESFRKLRDALEVPPHAIEIGRLTTMPQAMPDKYKDPDPVKGYRNYYINEKVGFAKWTNRETPEWFMQG